MHYGELRNYLQLKELSILRGEDNMLKRTVVFALSIDENQKQALEKTIQLYSKAYLYCIDIAWDMQLSKVKVHKATYRKLKKKLGLKSQYLCSSRNRAIETIKSLRALKSKGKKVSKPTSKRIPIRLDARTFSFDKLRENVSITTQKRRISIPLVWHKQAM